jgi:glycosyltransferase involved in cell wall biosynthesis
MVQALRSWAFGRHDVTLDVRPIPNEELQDYFRAADVAVCPYERTLNSGAALMATSFDLPVIGPRVGGFIDNLGESCAYLYEQGSDEGLLAAMRAAIDEAPAARRARSEACAELSARLSPGAVSAQFFQGLRKQLHNIQGQPTAARRESIQ